MKMLQVSKNGELLFRAGLADSYFLRLRGLIGRDVAAMGGLLIKPCSQIHTCFMSCKIDAVYLSKDNRILSIAPALKPGRFFKSVRHARSVLELPAGAAEGNSLKPGDKLDFTSGIRLAQNTI